MAQVVLLTLLLCGSSLALAAGSFNQNNWSGGTTVNNAANTTDQSGWNEFSSKETNLAVVNAGADLELVNAVVSTAMTADVDFSGGMASSTIVSNNSIGLTSAIPPVWTDKNAWDDSSIALSSAPAFGDLDNDGDYDLMIGMPGFGWILARKNVGSSSSPSWSTVGTSTWQMTVEGAPGLGDLDGDGDLDMLAGQPDGSTVAYENTGSVSAPSWGVQPTWSVASIGSNARPKMADLDGDGDLDLMIGGGSGIAYGYENTGSTSSPTWTAKAAWNSADVGSNAAPALADLDGDGDIDLVVGLSSGVASLAYENTGSTISPTWTRNSSWDVGGGNENTPDFADLDGDGDFDYIQGGTGTLNARENTGSAVYAAAGVFTSAVIDTGTHLAFTTLDYTMVAGGGATTTIQVRSGDNPSIDGTWGAFSTLGNITNGGDISGLTNKRYVQFEVTFSGGDTTATPTLDDITFNYNQYFSSATLTSSAFNSENTASTIDTVGWTENSSLPAGTNVQIQIRTAPDSAGSPGIWTQWLGPDGTSGTFWDSVNSDSGGCSGSGVISCNTVSAGQKDGVSDQWFQYLVTLTSSGLNSATVSDVLVGYAEAGVVIGGGFNQIDWGGGVTVNNAISAANQNGWDEFSSKDAGVSVVNTGADLELTPTYGSIVNTTDGDFSTGTNDTTVVSSNSVALVNTAPSFWIRRAGWDHPDIGTRSAPAFADLDDDGDLDLLVGPYSTAVVTYQNTGSATSPVWSGIAWNPPDIGAYTVPATTDLDNDGDIDLLLGGQNGIAYGVENTGNAISPAWTLNATWNLPDLGGYVGPSFFDLDNDGDQDLMVGENGGTVYGYKNTGSISAPAWTAEASWNLATGVSTARPRLADFDGDGDADMMVGFNNGTSRVYENTGTVSAPTWLRNTAWENGLDSWTYATIGLGDLDNDGDPDLIQGGYYGFGYAYEMSGPTFSNTGAFTSVVIDSGTEHAYTTLDYTTTIPANTAITIDVRAGNTVSPDGSWTAWQTGVTNGGDISLFTGNRYLQYQANFSSTDLANEPSLDDITFNHTQYPSPASLVSSPFNSQSANNIIYTLGWNENSTLPVGTNVQLQIRTAVDSAGSPGSWSSWIGPDGTSGTFWDSGGLHGNDCSGSGTIACALVLSQIQDGVNDQWFQYRFELMTSVGYTTPTVADFSMVYTDFGTIPGVTVTPTIGLVTTEEVGGSATFTIVLDSQPSADDVTIGLSSGDLSEGTVSPASLLFTSSNWSDPQTVTVTGVNDFLDDGDVAYSIITAAVTSTDTDYNGLGVSDVIVINTDNDASTISVSTPSGATTEAGDAATFTVVLNALPGDDVTIGLSSADTTEGTVSPASLTFTPANWSSAQTVTATGVDDAIDDDSVSYMIITAAATSADGQYNGVNANDVMIQNTDDGDTAGITVNAISGDTTEAGGTATFTIELDSEPKHHVMIGVSSSDVGEGTISTSYLLFPPADWNTPQTVTITGIDDNVVDGDITFNIITASAQSSDGKYNFLNASDVSVTNVDDDSVGIVVSGAGLITTEAGGDDTFTVKLGTQPTEDVTIGLSSDDTAEGTVSPASLTFTNGNWNIEQTVTVTGVDDALRDGNISYSIVTEAATSTDSNYNNVDASDVSITNTDDDLPGVTVTPVSGIATTEAGVTDTFTVVLDVFPTADDVTIGLSSSDTAEGTVSPASLTFTTSNWNVPQTVTVTGVDDGTTDGDVDYTIITAAVTSADSGYNGINPADVSAGNVDDDLVSVVSSFNQAEWGGGVSAATAADSTDQTGWTLYSAKDAGVLVNGGLNLESNTTTNTITEADVSDFAFATDAFVSQTSNNEFSTGAVTASTLVAGGAVKLSIATFTPVWSSVSWSPPDIGSYAAPNAVDLDDDGDLDLLIGTSGGSTIAYRNIGSSESPSWSANSAWNVSDIGSHAVPQAADLDGDGDFDLLVGAQDGISYGMENTGSKSSPVWTANSAWNTVDTGSLAGPELVDLDGDGDIDLMVGDDNGISYGYRNTGSTSAPIWTAEASWNMPDASSSARPRLADLDGDGDYDALVGVNNGLTYAYENTGDTTAPTWVRNTAWEDSADAGYLAVPELADFDGDGDMDRMIGSNGGNSYTYKNTGSLYNTSGTFTSGVIDSGLQFGFLSLDYTLTLPANAAITIDVRAGDVTDTNDASWTAWQTDIANGGDITALGSKRYVQYQANFSTTDTVVTPALDDITFNYMLFASGPNTIISDDGISLNINYAPATLGTYDSPYYLNGIGVSGNYAFVSDDSGNNTSVMRVIDISNPAAPAYVTATSHGARVFDVFVEGNYAYVAITSNGMAVVDISTPTAPVKLGTYNTAGWARGIHVDGNYAYIADNTSGMTIVDVSTPSALVGMSSYDTPGTARKVFASGNYAYLADSGSGLAIFDVSDPSTPVLLTTYPGQTNDVYIVDNYAYVVGAGLKILDISTPASPLLIGSSSSVGSGSSVQVVGTIAYISDGNTIKVIDVVDPTAPALLTSHAVTAPADIFWNGQYAFVAANNYGLHAVSLGAFMGAATYTSSINDAGAHLGFTTLDYVATTPTVDTVVSVDIRAGNTLVPDGSWTAWQSGVINGDNISVLGTNRYVQYRANLSTTDTATSPSLDDISVNFNHYTYSAQLTSSAYDTGDAAILMDSIGWTQFLPPNSDVRVQLRTAPDNAGFPGAWSDWAGPDGAPSSFWNSANTHSGLCTGSGAVSCSTTPSALRDGLNDQWLQYRVTFVSDGAALPIVSDITVTYATVAGVSGISVTPVSGLNTTEGNGTATFSVVLDGTPSANVSLDLFSSDTTEGTVSPSSLTFTNGNWDTAQVVTVTGVNDVADDGDITYSIITTPSASQDNTYHHINPLDVVVSNIDDDLSGITVSPISGINTTEAGGTATFTVLLDSQPSADVSIDILSSNASEGTVSPASLTFTPANWNSVQTVTATGVDDVFVDGDKAYTVITAVATSSDGLYSGLNADDVLITNDDDDSIGITVNPSSLSTNESGGFDTFTIVLNSQPASDVMVGLSSDDTTEGTVSPASMTFTSANWNTPQLGTVYGIDDGLVDGNILYNIITAPLVSSDSSYNGVNPANVSVTSIDDNTDVNVMITATTVGVGEESGGNAVFLVSRLGSTASALTVNYTVTGSATSGSDYVALTGSVIIGIGDSSAIINVTPISDLIGEGDEVVIVTLNPSASYIANVPAAATVVIYDDEQPSVPVVNFGTNQTVADGAVVTFSAALNKPALTYPVTIPYTVSGTAVNPADHDAADGTIIINSGLSSSVSFTVADDGLGDSDETVIFTMGSPTNADAGGASTLTVTISEDNLKPVVSLAAVQSTTTRLVVTGSGNVTVTATVFDPNVADTHTYDWSLTHNSLADIDDADITTFVFDPSSLGDGFYNVKLTVTDNNTPVEAASVELLLEVVNVAPTLSVVDTDGDGVTDDVESYGDANNNGIPDYLDPATIAINELQVLGAGSQSYLMRTEVGLILRLGDVAFAAGGDGAQITMDDIANYGDGEGQSPLASAQDAQLNTTGYFDFEIANLQEAGQSVKIVIPQLAELPIDAVYRKFDSQTGWRDFTIDSNNAIASAPGTPGECPLPGDFAYTAGLGEGHYCIQLTIEDGGPNDTDGIANHVIEDPGQVSVSEEGEAPQNDSESSPGNVSSGSGGGMLDRYLLWLVLAMLLIRMRDSYYRSAVR